MIPMNDFQATPAALRQAQVEAATRVLYSGWYILGNEGKRFEQMWARECGARYAVGVANGMDAIEVGLRAAGIGPGDEVITTTMSAFATVLAIFRAGATPVLADIEPDSALLSPASVEKCITPRTRAVLLVHLYGQVRNMATWVALCERHDILLLEDCAQSHLARAHGKTAGSFGLWGAYSFYPTKNLGALGDAGALVTNSNRIATDAAVLRNYGQSERYHHPRMGLNSRLDEIQAAMLAVSLEWLPEFTARRQKIARIYFEQIRNPAVQLLARPTEAESHVFHLFVVLCDNRDRLAAHMRERGVEALIHYPVPIHEQPPCASVKIAPDGLNHAALHAKRCLSLPCHPFLSEVELTQIIDAVNSFPG